MSLSDVSEYLTSEDCIMRSCLQIGQHSTILTCRVLRHVRQLLIGEMLVSIKQLNGLCIQDHPLFASSVYHDTQSVHHCGRVLPAHWPDHPLV